MIILGKEHKNIIENQIKSCNNSLKIISAYCKLDILKRIDNIIGNNNIEKSLLVRFLTSDVISGATDFEIIEYCKLNNWKLYIDFDMHAKTYVFDKTRCIIGSANATNKGVNLKDYYNCNYEISALQTMANDEYRKIQILFDEAIYVDDKIMAILNSYDISKLNNTSNDKKNSWEDQLDKIKPKCCSMVFAYDFPAFNSPEKSLENYDFLELDSTTDNELVYEAFLNSKCLLWLKTTLSKAKDKCMYYGELTARLQNDLLNDPTPYRSEVKQLLSNLLGWIQYFNIPFIQIDRPNYSQRIKLID